MNYLHMWYDGFLVEYTARKNGEKKFIIMYAVMSIITLLVFDVNTLKINPRQPK